MLSSYNNNNSEDNEDQYPGLSPDKSNLSYVVSQVENSAGQSQIQGSSGNNESSSTPKYTNQPLRDIRSTFSTCNTSNKTNFPLNSDVYRSTATALPSDDQPATSKQKKKISPPANEPTYRCTQTAKLYNKYQLDDEIGQQAYEKARLPDWEPEPLLYNKTTTCEDNRL